MVGYILPQRDVAWHHCFLSNFIYKMLHPCSRITTSINTQMIVQAPVQETAEASGTPGWHCSCTAHMDIYWTFWHSLCIFGSISMFFPSRHSCSSGEGTTNSRATDRKLCPRNLDQIFWKRCRVTSFSDHMVWSSDHLAFRRSSRALNFYHWWVNGHTSEAAVEAQKDQVVEAKAVWCLFVVGFWPFCLCKLNNW